MIREDFMTVSLLNEEDWGLENAGPEESPLLVNTTNDRISDLLQVNQYPVQQ
jgi:hypothetical protein